MAGNHAVATSRGVTPDASKDWGLLGFAAFDTRITQGFQDVRVPVASNQIFAPTQGTYPGLQLRQPLSQLSQRYNVSFASHTGQVFQPPALMLATNNTGTGLGLGKLKNLDVNAKSTFSNLLAKATSYGRLSKQIPVA
jgi:hypothetical protein